MPTRFWGDTDTQRARYGRFPEAVARGELRPVQDPNSE